MYVVPFVLSSGKTDTEVRMKRYGIRRSRKREYIKKICNGLVWSMQIAIVCIIAFVLVWYWGQRVSNIGDSMNPVLHNGDIVLVNRLIYDTSTPKRNDIIVFRPNGNENAHASIKRIVGLPGETIQLKDNAVYINGEKLKEDFQTTEIRDAGIAGEELVLGGDEYFVLGDNRAASEDSREADIGTVKRSEIEGKAWFVMLPTQHFGLIKD